MIGEHGPPERSPDHSSISSSCDMLVPTPIAELIKKCVGERIYFLSQCLQDEWFRGILDLRKVNYYENQTLSTTISSNITTSATSAMAP
jgi:hypothetical protein